MISVNTIFKLIVILPWLCDKDITLIENIKGIKSKSVMNNNDVQVENSDYLKFKFRLIISINMLIKSSIYMLFD